eukprot:TRINITY_DN5011_c0_g1_i1.p1 TRINITY_DN5011_c0_g1~~TRINITY_DN5011_c0_g1_i1.p1  ORF type:complete len:413 (-),score=67.01 TRINITY_DN5011_c0_g1_i1:49-1287(-)
MYFYQNSISIKKNRIVSLLMLLITGLQITTAHGEEKEGFCNTKGDNNCRWGSYLSAIKAAKANYSQEEYTCSSSCCFTERIHEDLRPFGGSLSQKDIISARNMVPSAVTYIIQDGELYRSPNCLFPARCKGIEYFLHAVKGDIKKDVEFVLGTQDWPHVSRHFLETSIPPPVFSFSKTPDYLDIGFPAWTFKEGGPAITSYPNGLGEWDEMRERILSRSGGLSWRDKVDKAFFRGSRTSSERDNLILLSRERPDLVDASYTKNQAWKSNKDTLDAPPANEVPLEGHCQYKYLFNYRGVAASFRFKHLFLCQSLVFHVGNEWTEFFYHALVPWIHYVPVPSGSSQDMIRDLILFFRAHPEIAEGIAKTGHEIIKNKLNNEQVTCYWRELLNAYGDLLTFKPSRDASFIHLTQK